MKNEKTAAPTGCYKCGLPGHWSRDCPSSSAPDSNPNSRPSNFDSNNSSFRSFSSCYSKPAVAAKPMKIPRTRPKLTPELLLSDDGLGYVLRHFPRAFRYRGRGHEVSDLGNLIRIYGEWHSHLIPYYSFDQFVPKTEQVAATKRVKTCISELRERVAGGGDPKKLHEPPAEHDGPISEQDILNPGKGVIPKGQSHPEGVSSSKVNAANVIEEDMLHEIYQKTLEEDMELVASGRALFSKWDQLKAAPRAAQTTSPIESPDSMSTRELKVAIDNFLLILSMDLDTAVQLDNLSVLNAASLTFSKVSTSHISLGHRTMLTGLHRETEAMLERSQMLNAKINQLHTEKAQHDRLSCQVDANQFDFQKLSDELSVEDLELSRLQKQLAELQQKIEDCKTRKTLKRQAMAEALAQTKPLIVEFQKLRSQGDLDLDVALAQTKREKRRLNSEWAKLRNSFILFQEGISFRRSRSVHGPMLKLSIVSKTADTHNKTPEQVILRW